MKLPPQIEYYGDCVFLDVPRTGLIAIDEVGWLGSEFGTQIGALQMEEGFNTSSLFKFPDVV